MYKIFVRKFYATNEMNMYKSFYPTPTSLCFIYTLFIPYNVYY